VLSAVSMLHNSPRLRLTEDRPRIRITTTCTSDSLTLTVGAYKSYMWLTSPTWILPTSLCNLTIRKIRNGSDEFGDFHDTKTGRNGERIASRSIVPRVVRRQVLQGALAIANLSAASSAPARGPYG